MSISISFADLAHRGHTCNAVPYGVGLVAANARKEFGDAIEPRLFKSPDTLGDFFEETPPQVACFSAYIWNTRLSLAYAKRLKRAHPETVIVFGGPNYPIVADEQQAFLLEHPEVDFFIFRDGEEPFARLLGALIDAGMDANRVKASGTRLPNCHYIRDGALVAGDMLPLIRDLDDLPSPYLTGMCDEFMDILVPLTQTTRGCPFRCTFCQDGADYAKLVRRHSPERIRAELRYIAERAKRPQLYLADLNFGMYKQDLETCRIIAELRHEFSWPDNVDLNGKNQKDRVLEATRIVEASGKDTGVVTLVAAIQSTHPDVLKAVRRENVHSEDMLELAKAGESQGSSSFSEIILGLPGDSKEAHIGSIHELMDCSINVIRSHQFIMLNGAEASTRESRETYRIDTRYRVMPRTVARYTLFGDDFIAPEIDEICVGNSTLSFQDYLDCRQYDLTVEIFYNYGIFHELYKFLRRNGVSVPTLIDEIHHRILADPGPLKAIYEGFVRETKEVWTTEAELSDFLARPGVPERYMNGELGNNEQLTYRALAVFQNMDDLHRIAYGTARELLAAAGRDRADDHGYLDELAEFSLMCKRDMLSPDSTAERHFHYDFVKLNAVNFNADPVQHGVPDGVRVKFSHSDEQRGLIEKYLATYGEDKYGLGHVLGSATHVSNFYRKVHAA